MVEVHLVRQERAAAVHARDSTEVAQELEGDALPSRDAVNLALSIPSVIADVVWALVTRARHQPKMATPESRVNRTRS